MRTPVILPMQANVGQILVDVTLNIELFILVIHFDHFLKGCNNVNSFLKLKHDLSSQIPGLGYNFCHINELFETLSTSNVNIENLNIQSKGLVMKYIRKSRDVSKS